jgi:hypothetical protein
LSCEFNLGLSNYFVENSTVLFSLGMASNLTFFQATFAYERDIIYKGNDQCSLGKPSAVMDG